MNNEYIKKYLGENWLKNQLEVFNQQLWIAQPEFRGKVSNAPVRFMLEKIDGLIKKLESVTGFEKWALEAKTSKSFEDCLFEIMIFENLLGKADYMEIKPNNHGKTPEAVIIKGKDKFHIEAKKLNKIPSSLINKVSHLLKNTRDQFKLSRGILFIGCFDFFTYEKSEVKIKEELNELKDQIERKLHNFRENRKILAVVLTNFYIQTDMKNSSLQKQFFIIPRPVQLGGFKDEDLREIFDVDNFLVKENIFD